MSYMVLRVFCCIWMLLLLSTGIASALDAPHINLPGYTVSCGSCHWISGGQNPPWGSVNYSDPKDNTINNRRCGACHDGSVAPKKTTHSSFITASKYWLTSGGWSTQCTDCHNGHDQRQQRGWGTLSFAATGAVPVIAGWNTAAATTTVLLPSPLSADYLGYYFMPDKGTPVFYKVLSGTWNTVNIKVRGQVQTSAALFKPNGYAFVYARNIKDRITYKNPQGIIVGSSEVKLFGPEGSRGPGDQLHTDTSVCYVCHTKASPPSSISDHAAVPSARCSSCHYHDEGFKGACTNCHGYPPTENTQSFPDGLVWSTITGSETAGAHALHVNEKGIKCEVCHVNSTGSGLTHNKNRTVSIGFSWYSTAGGTYNGQSGVLYNSSDGGKTTVSAGGLRQCSNIYCHSDGTSVSTKASPSGASPAWDWGPGPLACNGCHNYPPAYPNGNPKSNSHENHAKLSMSSSWTTILYTCNFCHSGTTTDGLNISGALNHINNAFNISAGGWATFTYSYSTSGGTCTNNYCHSNVQPNGGMGTPDKYAVVKWGATNIGCGSCHNKSSEHNSYYWATTLMNSGSHSLHWAKESGSCIYCHDTNPGSPNCSDRCHSSETQRKHVNGQVDIAFLTIGGKSGTYSGTPKPGDGYGKCSNTYCHGDSISPSWGSGGSVACSTCHSANNTLAGAHNRHYESSAVALNHWASNNSTAGEYRFNCGICHEPAISHHSKGPIGGGQSAAVYFDYTVMQGSTVLPTGGTYNRGVPAAAGLNNPDRGFGWTDGTCSNIYCHNNGAYISSQSIFPLEYISPKWDGTSPDPQGDSYKCNNCHMWNIRHDAHQRHVYELNYTCNECHSLVVDSCGNASRTCNIKDKARHANGRYEVSGNFWYTFREYNNGMGGSCLSNTCHQAQVPAVNRDDWSYNHFWSTIRITSKVPSGSSCTVTVRIDNSTPYTDSNPYTYLLNWGDLTPETGLSSWGTWAQINHTYQQFDIYKITWRVKDARDRRMAPPNPGWFTFNACN